MSRFSGTIDRRTLELGPAYFRSVRRVRVATWALVAQVEEEEWLQDLRRRRLNFGPEHGNFTNPDGGWKKISNSRQAAYLRGSRAPQKHTLREVATCSPSSFKVFHSVLWQVLSPQTDLETCMNTVSMFDSAKLDALVGDLLAGKSHHLAEKLADLNTTGALVALIRLLIHENEFSRAFDAGRALAQALCYHAVNPLFSAGAAMLWDLVSHGVLAGLQKGCLQFSLCRNGFRFFSEALKDRLACAHALYGIHRLLPGSGFKWETIVDINQECILAFSAPEGELPELVHAFLEAAPGTRHSASEIERDPLFIRVSSE